MPVVELRDGVVAPVVVRAEDVVVLDVLDEHTLNSVSARTVYGLLSLFTAMSDAVVVPKRRAMLVRLSPGSVSCVTQAAGRVAVVADVGINSCRPAKIRFTLARRLSAASVWSVTPKRRAIVDNVSPR